MCLIPAPFAWEERFGGIFTGMRILACICLAKTNRKVRTKSFARRYSRYHLGIFSAMLCGLSYGGFIVVEGGFCDC